MAHIQLRRKDSGDRVLPVYYSDNYVSLVPDEARTIHVEAAETDLKEQVPLVTVDGWNVTVKTREMSDAALVPNEDADPSHWPDTGLPFASQPRGIQP
jgi:beta-mannosidase